MLWTDPILLIFKMVLLLLVVLSKGVAVIYNNCVISRLEQDERRGNIVSVLKKISEKHSNFYIIDTINIVSKNNYISSYKDNTPLYYDDDHPNFIFNQYIYPLFINKLNSI